MLVVIDLFVEYKMNKTEALIEIKKLIVEYQNTNDPYEAESSLENAFSLRDKYNLDCTIMSIRDYHMTMISKILASFYFGDLLCAKLQIPSAVSLENLTNKDEVIISFTYVKTKNGLDYELDYEQTKHITLINSQKMDNLFKLRDYIYSNVREHLNDIVKINMPELALFIKRLNQDIYFSSCIRNTTK